MKGLSGDAAFLKLLQIDPHIKCVLSSGVTPDEELLTTLEKHGCRFIEKPFNINQLSNVLESVIRG